jgi:hypothetical protein
MKWNMLALIGIFVGICLIRGGIDSLVEWRIWFLGLSGLILFILGSTRLFLALRKFRSESAEKY